LEFNFVSLIFTDSQIMKPNLVKAAAEVIPNPKILVNVVSRRVRQLCLGYRPMVESVPGLGYADLALSEIAAGKLTFESTSNQNAEDPVAQVVEFPAVVVKKPKKKAA
jgi:DNA-directed RNA polymerase subunit omega